MADTNFTVNADVSGALSALQKLSNRIEEVGKNFGSVFSAANTATASLVASLTAVGVATAAYADQVVDIAKANQLATAEVMGLGKALALNGGQADSVGRMFQQLSNNIEQANSGNIKALGTFQRLGVSIQDLGSLSNSELNQKLLKSLGDLKDPTERAALAAQIYGKTLTGVDIKGLSEDTADLTSKYGDNQAAIEAAAAAFDKMASIIGDLKVAFAVTFEPVFKYIANLKVEVKDLIELWKLMAVALSIVVGASVLGGFVKLIGLVRTLNSVVSKNPLLTIAGALLSVGVGAATYLGITKEIEDAQEDVNTKVDELPPKIETVKRSQEGLIDVFEKQKRALEKAGDQIDLNFQKSLKSTKNEYDSLFLLEDQKKIKEATAKIEEDAQSALLSLKQANDALDKESQSRNAQNYTDQKRRIEDLAATQKKAIEAQISDTQRLKAVLSDAQSASQSYSEMRIQAFEAMAKMSIDTAGISDRIELEGKLNELTKIRGALTAQISKVSESERANVITAINAATSRTEILNGNYQDINSEVEKYIRNLAESGYISNEAANKILSNSQITRKSIAETTDELVETNKAIAESSRTFNYGWNLAFKQYAEDATNAAMQARNIFAKTMQGMEDLIVNFAKTGKFEWKNFVASLAEELLRSQIKQLMTSIFSFGGGTGGGQGGGSSGGIFGALGSMFAGMFANGGTIPGGKFGLVGERGPEFISGPATITPMSGGGNVTYNINAVDAMSFKSMIARDPSFIHAVAMQGAAGIPGRR